MQSHWYALYTRHQHEKMVSGILGNKGFEVFLPLYSTVHKWKDRTKQLSLPLFPGYVFLKEGLERKLDVLTTPGVCSFVGASGPSTIPPEQIESIKRAVDGPSAIEPHPFIKCGDHVRVTRGPLEGMVGILVRKRDLYRLVISVDLLGRSAAVDIDSDVVERV